MDKLLQAIIAFFTALSSAFGGPVDSPNIPDRPAIVAPTPVPTAVESKSPEAVEIEIGGVVQSMQNGSIVVSGITVYVGPQTQVKGQLQVGARIMVEAVKRANEIRAREIRVIDSGSSSQASSSSSHTSTSSRSSSSGTSQASSSSSASSSESSRSSSSESSSESSKSSSASSGSSQSSQSTSSTSSSSENSRSSSSESTKTSSSTSSGGGGSSSSKSSDGSKSSSSSSK